jgi:hypothetical protein
MSASGAKPEEVAHARQRLQAIPVFAVLLVLELAQCLHTFFRLQWTPEQLVLTTKPLFLSRTMRRLREV